MYVSHPFSIKSEIQHLAGGWFSGWGTSFFIKKTPDSLLQELRPCPFNRLTIDKTRWRGKESNRERSRSSFPQCNVQAIFLHL